MEYLLTIDVKNRGKRKGIQMCESLHLKGIAKPELKGYDLFITSAILQPFIQAIKYIWVKEEPQDHEVRNLLALFLKTITDSDAVEEAPIPLEGVWEQALNERSGMQLIIDELYSLAYAVGYWLSPDKSIAVPGTATGNAATSPITGDSITGNFNFTKGVLIRETGTPAIDFDYPMPFVDAAINMHAFASYCLKTRAKQVFSSPSVTKEGNLIRIYESAGLLPLAWMEIWFALDHGIKAKICHHCAKLFVPSPFHPKTTHCQSNECKKAYLIDRKGGIDGYRKWERERKKKKD